MIGANPQYAMFTRAEMERRYTRARKSGSYRIYRSLLSF